jgi:hypothetical protein
VSTAKYLLLAVDTFSHPDPDVGRPLDRMSDRAQNVQSGVTRSRRLRDKVAE